MTISFLWMLGLLMADSVPLEVKVLLCEEIKQGQDLEYTKQLLELSWLSKGDTVTGHTAIADVLGGESGAIESVTESSVADYAPGTQLQFTRVESEGKEWVCVKQ